MQEDLLTFVRSALRLPESARALDSGYRVTGALVHPDLVWESREAVYLVEIKRGVATVEAVGQLALLKEGFSLVGRQRQVIPVLVTWSAPPRVREALALIGGELVEAPAHLLAPSTPPTGGLPISSEKAWKVVTALLERRAVKSYRALAERSGTSLGWAHQVTRELAGWGIVEVAQAGIRMARPELLLDVVALERPLRSLVQADVPTDFTSTGEAASEITRILNRRTRAGGVQPFAFAAHTAATLHTGYAFRHDRLDLYAPPDALLPSNTRRKSGRPVMVRIYRPDRDVFSDSVLLKGVRVTSRSQTLLDLAGLGYEASDIALKVIQSYAR